MENNIYFKRDIFEIKDYDNEKYDSEDISEFLNNLVFYSLKERVSDIHVESKERVIKIRVRIDGILKDYKDLNKSFV